MKREPADPTSGHIPAPQAPAVVDRPRARLLDPFAERGCIPVADAQVAADLRGLPGVGPHPSPTAEPAVLRGGSSARRLSGVTVTGMLHNAIRGPCGPPLRLLPDRAADVLERLRVPPRLAPPLRLVHDVACQLAD
jgi:hypothetical protein